MHMPVSAKFRKSPVKSRSRDGRGRGELVIITGMSGSGKASVLKAFEDLGYYCVDNLPVGLIPRFAELVGQSSEIERTALVVDVREGTQLDELPAIVKRSEEHTSELQSRSDLVCRLLLEKKKLCNCY